MNCRHKVDNTLDIIQVFASAGWGGGEKYAYDLSRELLRNGHRVAIVSRPSRIIFSKAAESGIPHTQLPLKGIFDLASALKLARKIRREGTDIIHVHNFKDAFTAVYANTLCGGRARIVVTRHLVRKGKRSIPYRWLYRHLDRIVFVSELARDEFLTTAPASTAGKTEVIYNSVAIPSAISEAAPKAESLREKFGISTDTFLVGFTGRIAPEKGPDILIRAIGAIDEENVAAVFIGGGDSDYVQRLQTLAQECGAAQKVFFHGYTDNVYGLIGQVDAGVAPSIAREAFCLSAIEYMWAGKPVVTTDNGAQREYIRNEENGLLVPPSDAAALADAIRMLAIDPALRERLAHAGRRTFTESFAYDAFYSRMMRAYLPDTTSAD